MASREHLTGSFHRFAFPFDALFFICTYFTFLLFEDLIMSPLLFACDSTSFCVEEKDMRDHFASLAFFASSRFYNTQQRREQNAVSEDGSER